jgi:hypothetical protein
MINRNSNKTTKSAGKVEMSLEAYNEMLLELTMYRNAFTIGTNKHSEEWVEIRVDTKMLKPMIEEEMKNFPEHVLDDYYIECGTNQYIAKKPVQE